MAEGDPRDFFKKYVATRQPAVLRCAESHFKDSSAKSIIKKFWTNQELREKSGKDTIRCEIRDDVAAEGMCVVSVDSECIVFTSFTSTNALYFAPFSRIWSW